MFRSRFRIQPVAAHPAKSAPTILRGEYKRDRRVNMSDGMVAAATINCIASIPRLNPRMLTTRCQQPSSRWPKLVANARFYGYGFDQLEPKIPAQDLPLSRPCRRTADPSSREKVRLENHALFFAVPTGVTQEIDR
jgi:hypothetical protein